MKSFVPVSTILSLFCIGMLFPALSSPEAVAAKPLEVEVLFMNHGPMRPTIRNLKALFQRYASTTHVSWYDFDQESAKTFMKKKGIKGHIPLLIFINGNSAFDLGGKKVTFMGFPTGKGPFRQVEGQWTLKDLEQALQSLSR